MSPVRIVVTFASVVLGIVTSTLLTSACLSGDGDCMCREPRPLVPGTFQIAHAQPPAVAVDQKAALEAGTVMISPEGVLIDYQHGTVSVRVTYKVSRRYDVTP